MADEWQSVKLGDVPDLLTGFPFKSNTYTEDSSSPRLLRGDNVGQGVLRWEGAKRWPKDATKGLDAYWLRKGDVILAMDGPWIEAGLKFGAIREVDLPTLLVQRVARLRGTERLDAGYLKHLIASPGFTDHVLAIETGTAVPHISGDQIKSFKFPLPPLSGQQAIGRCLTLLDDKIDLNRRMNETLEAMARALFKSWFVDFGPVRAKAEKHEPGLTGPLSDLVPDSFEGSEMGQIPTGWGTQHVGDLLSLDKGISYKGQFLADIGIPMVNLGCFLGRGRFTPQALKAYVGEYKSRHVVNPRDLVLANTDITQRREIIGSPALIPPQGNLKQLYSVTTSSLLDFIQAKKLGSSS